MFGNQTCLLHYLAAKGNMEGYDTAGVKKLPGRDGRKGV